MLSLKRVESRYRKMNTMIKYQNRKTKQIGTVIHYKGSTTTLQFDDGSELILSSYNLRNDWTRVKDEHLDKLLGKKNKVKFKKFVEIMKAHNASKPKDALEGVIVYSNSNFNKSYSELSRSYVVTSDSSYFKNGNELVGDCLDKSEYNVELSLYDWDVDYCYFTTYYVSY